LAAAARKAEEMLEPIGHCDKMFNIEITGGQNATMPKMPNYF
jgi:hypothetical protein